MIAGAVDAPDHANCRTRARRGEPPDEDVIPVEERDRRPDTLGEPLVPRPPHRQSDLLPVEIPRDHDRPRKARGVPENGPGLVLPLAWSDLDRGLEMDGIGQPGHAPDPKHRRGGGATLPPGSARVRQHHLPAPLDRPAAEYGRPEEFPGGRVDRGGVIDVVEPQRPGDAVHAALVHLLQRDHVRAGEGWTSEDGGGPGDLLGEADVEAYNPDRPDL